MKPTRISRRNRYKKLLSRLRPGKPLYVIEAGDVLADLDPGLLVWRAGR
jgi:hypothetical protein